MSAGAIPPPGDHGGDGESVAAALGIDPADMLDLSASMNPCAADPLPIVTRHLRAGLDRYPNPARATAALADIMDVDIDRLLLTNGGAEAISLLTAEIGGRVVEPAFALHPRNRRPDSGGGVSSDEGGSAGLPLWRANPDSPSGLLAAPTETAGVWDEAFYPLAAGAWTRGDHGVPVVGSLTKLLGVPGLRVGYVLADPALIAACRLRQPGWSVNGLVCAALGDLLASVDLPASARGIASLREELIALLAGYGLGTRPSDANWVLAEAPGLRERLAPHGVLVRDCASFGLPGVARIAVPDADGLQRLDRALAATVSTPPTEPPPTTQPSDTAPTTTAPAPQPAESSTP